MENNMEEFIKLEYKLHDDSVVCSASIQENGKYRTKVRVKGKTKALARVQALQHLSDWLIGSINNELPEGWYLDETALWGVSENKNEAPVRMDFASGQINYDTLEDKDNEELRDSN